MRLSSERFSQIRRLISMSCFIAIAGALLAIGLGLTGYGSLESASSAWFVLAGGFVLFAAVVVMAVSPLLLKIESTLARQLSAMRDLHETIAKQNKLLEAVVENTSISDSAKSLAHRNQELETVRSAIRDDIRGERWEAAFNLADEMERRFGYKEEAERIREELDDARGDAIQLKLKEAIDMIEQHFATHEWDRALREIERLTHALPNDARVLRLRDRMSSLKDKHKGELMHAWDEAVRRSDTDQAIDVLKGLDQYLSSTEARALQDSARTVFKEKLLQLGVQFRFAVMEHRWQDALDIGLELARDFPNARMANEVREALDTLRERARQQASSQELEVPSEP